MCYKGIPWLDFYTIPRESMTPMTTSYTEISLSAQKTPAPMLTHTYMALSQESEYACQSASTCEAFMV